MSNRNIGRVLVVVSVVFGIAETDYFGNSMLPSCTAELVCDIVSLFMTLSGLNIIWNESKRP